MDRYIAPLCTFLITFAIAWTCTEPSRAHDGYHPYPADEGGLPGWGWSQLPSGEIIWTIPIAPAPPLVSNPVGPIEWGDPTSWWDGGGEW